MYMYKYSHLLKPTYRLAHIESSGELKITD